MTHYIKVRKMDYQIWKLVAIILTFLLLLLAYTNVTINKRNVFYYDLGKNNCESYFNLSISEITLLRQVRVITDTGGCDTYTVTCYYGDTK